MAKYCSKECKELGAVCDFCKYYDFNADSSGCYVGKGYCNYHKVKQNPEAGCNDFVCDVREETK